MKKYIKFLFLALIPAAAVVSCDNPNEHERFSSDPGSGWVQFEDSNDIAVVYGNATEITIPILLEAPVNQSGLEVTYTITDVEGSSSGAFSGAGTATVPAGSREGELVLPLTSTGLTSAVVFDITLTGTNKSNVEAGLSDDSKPVVKRVCLAPIVIAASYNGAATAVGIGAGPDFVTSITPVSGQANTYTVETAWGDGFVADLTGNPAFVGQYVYEATMVVDAAAGTVTLTTDDPETFPGGTGTIDACSGVITYRLSQGLFTNPFQVDVVLTP